MCSYLFSHLFTQISFLCFAKNEGTQSSLSLVNKLCNINTPKIIEGFFLLCCLNSYLLMSIVLQIAVICQ